MRILVLVAHPDDEVIMSGATISKMKRKGHEVHVGYYSNNEEAYFGSTSQESRAKRARKEAYDAGKILGFSQHFLPFKDMHLGDNKGSVIKSTIDILRTMRPDIVITHNKNDKHIDHRTLGELVPEANFQSGCKLCGGNVVWSAPVVLQGEVDLEKTNQFNFNVVSEVSESDVKNKIDAFSCYSTVKEEHKTQQNVLVDKLKLTMNLRGSSIGIKYGEAFILDNYSIQDSKSIRILSEFLEC